MLDWGSVWKGVKDFGGTVVDTVSSKNFGTTLAGVGALGQAYAGYQSAKAQENYNKQQEYYNKQQENYNNQMIEMQKDEIKRKNQKENLAQSELDDAISSVWGTQPTTTETI